MIKLAVAVGFLAVFGLVGYAIVVLLTKKTDPKTDVKPKPKTK